MPEGRSQDRLAKVMQLERYGEDFHPATGMGGFEIWVPIKESSKR